MWKEPGRNKMGNEIEVITNPAVNSWLTSLTTTGLVIVALTVIITALSKFGVLNKLIDRQIKKRGLSTGFNREAMEEVNGNFSRLLANDEETKIKMDGLFANDEETKKRIDSIECSIKEIKIESDKKAVFNGGLFLIDRMAAGLRFMLAGGNSETKEYLLNQLCFEDLETWNGLCKIMGASKYWRNESDRPAKKKSRTNRSGK
jgi:hypothetical protein